MERKKVKKITKSTVNQNLDLKKTTKSFTIPTVLDNSYFHCIVLASLAFLLYGWTYNFNYSLSDPYVLDAINKTTNDFNGIITIFKSPFAGIDYRPVSILSFWIERYIFNGINPHVSHLVNVLIYALILICIYNFILISKFYTDNKKLKLLAFLCCLIFLIHPNHVSVVANIKSRDNLLSMLFGLLVANQGIRFYDDRRNFRIILSILFITLGLLSKLDMYIFILTPILIIFLYRKINTKTFIRFIAGVFIINFIIFIATDGLRNNANHSQLFNITFDKTPLVGHDTFLNRISFSFTTLYYYIKFLIVPTGYYFIFGYNQIPLTGLFSPENIIAFTTTLALFVLSIWYYKRDKIYLFSFLFFMCSIAYALNFFAIVANILMDRYNFIPSLGFCLALSALVINLHYNNKYKSLIYSIFLVIIFIFTYFTVQRTKDWRSLFTLIKKDMPYLKKSVNAYRIAGAEYVNAALREEMKPNYNKSYADSMIKIGEQYADAGIKLYDKEIQTWELKGLCYFYRKDYPNALSCFLKCKDIDSNYLSGLNYLGFTYWKLHNIDSAYYYFNYVMNREYIYNYSANNMINMLIENNRQQEADSIINVLRARFPNDIWLNRRIQELNTNKKSEIFFQVMY